MQTIVLSTGNAHKLAEVRAILGDGFQVLSLRDFPGAPAAEETADSFGGNALIKSVGLAAWLVMGGYVLPEGTFVMADDSGLEVRTLAWAPGVQSARFAALDDGRPGNSPDAENNAKLLKILGALPGVPRVARFRCVLACTPLCGRPKDTDDYSLRAQLAANTGFYEGVCDGRIAERAAGQGGFGYDPLFVPDGHSVSMAELGEAVKNRISHRARALDSMLTAFRASQSVPRQA